MTGKQILRAAAELPLDDDADTVAWKDVGHGLIRALKQAAGIDGNNGGRAAVASPCERSTIPRWAEKKTAKQRRALLLELSA